MEIVYSDICTEIQPFMIDMILSSHIFTEANDIFSSKNLPLKQSISLDPGGVSIGLGRDCYYSVK